MTPSKRLAARFKGAFEHPSEDARKQYLKEHPQADPSNHSVKAPKDEAAQPEDPHGEKPKKAPEEGAGKKKPVEKAKSFFKGLSDKAKAFVAKSGAAVQKFVSDTEHRAQVMEDAGKTIMASPKTYAKRLVQTAKEEIHEFKEAGGALKHLVQGKQLDHHQKKALKTVAIHMGIAVAAAALTSTGVLAGAAAFGKGMVQKIALKAAAHALEKVHLVQEIQHIGHGAHELMHLIAAEGDDKPEERRKIEKIDPEEAFAILIMQSVIKSMRDLDDKDMAEILEGASGEQEKQASNYEAGAQLITLIDQAAQSFSLVSAWNSRFPSVLTAARAESPALEGRVVQARFVRYFTEIEATYEALILVDQQLDDLFFDVPQLTQLANQARQLVRIPRKAEIAYAISDIDFVPNALTGRDDITYSIDTLKEWADVVGAWSTKGRTQLRQLGTKANRLTQVRALV